MTEDTIKNSDKKVEKGDVVSVHYVGKLEDGTVFDTSEKEAALDAGIYNEMRDYKPLTFTVGAGQMIKGFDEGVVSMKMGEEKTLKISPEEAYGEYMEEYVRELPRNAVKFIPEVGMQLATETGLRGTITEVSEEKFVVDFNHSLAGKTLIFKVKVVSVEA
ncbi:MAG: peptidylprolyl isomerase [Euryarchaeota archaeon]|nr:peptidylprolyl isomerase [Euryarchaeota archaeon]